MTDRKFWKKLDEVSRQEMTMMRELSFQTLLKQGYEEDRGILIACFYGRDFPGMAKQAYIEIDGERYIICYTNRDLGKTFFTNIKLNRHNLFTMGSGYGSIRWRNLNRHRKG